MSDMLAKLYDLPEKESLINTLIKRGIGIGKALLLACMHAMAANGYAYAIIGEVGPADFYAKTAGAVIIKDSSPGIYCDQLTKK